MKIEQTSWTEEKGWSNSGPGRAGISPQLAFLFGNKEVLGKESVVGRVRSAYPAAHFLGCSTAGEICGTSVCDDALVVTGVEFADTQLQAVAIHIGDPRESFEAGVRLASMLGREGLIHVFVLSEGLNINGSELVKGITGALPQGVTVTGGLSGDGTKFKETYVVRNDRPTRDTIVAIGFYGSRLKVGCGSLGGWDMFGPERVVTRAKANVLYELDGKSALELYKTYLGEHAKGLPATGLLFPLSVRVSANDSGVVRTILAVNEEEQSMTFAGDIAEGAYARLMKANFDRLIDGAVGAAQASHEALGTREADLAIMISCVGRRMVLQQRIEEELEGVREVVGQKASMTGFYSYGEISPFTQNAKCELHNQTMTITTFSED